MFKMALEGMRMTATRGLILLILTGSVMLTWPARARQDGEMFQNRAITIGTTEYHFRVFTPKGWTKKKKSPVILFLHGAGERGDDNLAQTKVGIGPAILRQQETLPFIVVLPQCPRNRWWTEPDMQAQALKALEQTVKEFNGDPLRTYLTGLSMGGYGSWIMAAGNHSLFAAVAVVCGGVRPPPGINVPQPSNGLTAAADPYGAVAAKIGKTPVWVFHGGADPVVPVSESRKMVEAIKAAGGGVRYSEYEGVGHNSWDMAYGEAEIFPWMLGQKLKAVRR
jgi:predicted peptidase